MIKIACCQYQIEALSNWQAYAAKIEKLVIAAKQAGASLLLMPEYAGIEIACKSFETDKELFEALQPAIAKYLDFYQHLAKSYQIYIQAGTIIEKITATKFINRAYLFSPNGLFGYQDKLQLTATEKFGNLIQYGNDQKIFVTSLGKIGIAICYDSEFPEIIRCLVQNGTEIILVPSYTTSHAGYNRVFLSCRARAIENQCYVAIAYIINKVKFSKEVDETFGQAAILGPVDSGFSDDGIIAQGAMNQPMLVYGDISLKKLAWIRTNGEVHNYEDAKRYTLQTNNVIRMIDLS